MQVTSSSPSRPPSPAHSLHGSETSAPTLPAERPTNAKLATDSLKQSAVDAGRSIGNSLSGLGFSLASGAHKVAAKLDGHTTQLSQAAQPRRHAAAKKTADVLHYLAKHSEKGARILSQPSLPTAPPAPKR